MGEAGEKAVQEGRGCRRVALVVDLDEDVAGGAIDCDEDVGFDFFQVRQVFQIDVNEAHGCLFESSRGWLFGGGLSIEAGSAQTAIDGVAGEAFIHASAHDLDDVIQGKIELEAQLADEFLFGGEIEFSASQLATPLSTRDPP